jgi:hypothetical protein
MFFENKPVDTLSVPPAHVQQVLAFEGGRIEARRFPSIHFAGCQMRQKTNNISKNKSGDSTKIKLPATKNEKCKK